MLEFDFLKKSMRLASLGLSTMLTLGACAHNKFNAPLIQNVRNEKQSPITVFVDPALPQRYPVEGRFGQDQKIDTEPDQGAPARLALAQQIRRAAYCVVNFLEAATEPEANETSVEDAKSTFTHSLSPVGDSRDFFTIKFINGVPGKRPDALEVAVMTSRGEFFKVVDIGLDGNPNQGYRGGEKEPELLLPHREEEINVPRGNDVAGRYVRVLREGTEALLSSRCQKPEYEHLLTVEDKEDCLNIEDVTDAKRCVRDRSRAKRFIGYSR